jgi:hypothetical protein
MLHICYAGTLGVLALRPSGFCNIGAYSHISILLVSRAVYEATNYRQTFFDKPVYLLYAYNQFHNKNLM